MSNQLPYDGPESFVHAIGDSGESVYVNIATLDGKAIGYLVDYGLKQSIADSYSGAAKTAAAMREDGTDISDNELRVSLAEKRLESIVNGTIGIRSSGPRDPLGKAVKDLCAIHIANWSKKPLDERNGIVADIKAAKTAANKSILSVAKAMLEIRVVPDDEGDDTEAV